MKILCQRRCAQLLGLVCVSTLLLQLGRITPVEAVDEGKTSYTADAVCAFRSIGAQDPDPMTRNPDDMAKLFVNPAIAAHFPGLGLPFEDAKIAMDHMQTGVYYWINARTHDIDAALVRALRSGIRQVVILGAGFDSRAYRFHKTFPDARFYEIDLPATSADKQQRVTKIIGKKPTWVSFVPIDFNTQTLDQVMAKAGFATDQKAFFIWEGVTYYITQAGVESTMRFIANNAFPGSRIVFDYMLATVVQGKDYSAYGSRNTVFTIANIGEPYIFGIDPRHLKTFVNLHGLDLKSDLGPRELTSRYLIGSNGRVSGRMAEFLHIVHAEVPQKSKRQDLIHNAEKEMVQRKSAQPADAKPKEVILPQDVKALLENHSRCMERKDYATMTTLFSKKYLFNGASRDEALMYIRGLYGKRPVVQFRFVITRFDRAGDHARIDGYVQRKGFRTPIPFPAMNIARESDGRWRWHGNQR